MAVLQRYLTELGRLLINAHANIVFVLHYKIYFLNPYYKPSLHEAYPGDSCPQETMSTPPV
jgi:hypothetical protein